MNEIKLEVLANALRNKIGVNAIRSIFTRERVQAAQAVIETTKDGYFDDVQVFTKVFHAAAAGDIKPNQIYETTKSLKAQAEGLGFVFLMELSDSLYKFLQQKPGITSAAAGVSFDRDESLVVRKYAEAIAAALDKRERGKGGMVEAGILDSLELLKRKFTKGGA